MSTEKLKIVFFGGEPLSVPVLEELTLANLLPQLIVCNPDRAQGRKMEVTPPPVKIWAQEHKIPTLQPEYVRDADALTQITSQEWDLFIVVAYSQIMPKWLIDLPKYGTINLHPSMLPKLRGASPIRSAILQGHRETGVTIMLMDEKLDHGQILEQKPSPVLLPLPGKALDKALAQQGGTLLCDVIPRFITGEIIPKEQDHTQATFCSKITKEMGELQIDPFNLPTGEEAYNTYLKICAFDGWPGTFFFYNKKRIKITDASLSESTEVKLEINSVIPEGKKEMDFKTFLNSLTSQYN